jgi:peptidoglycan/xylan/chitin deacetylase (PgdA/CDA1 family)
MTFVAVCATEQPRPECLAALTEPHVFVDEVLSLARNAALEACDEEWIAYVDGDVVVADGWAIPDVDDDVAVVSGPLTGDFATHGATKGSDPNVALTTFHGGNVAFRAPALRGVGGFWPARGHRFARDWFSEEHEAQRELARAGWRAVFDERMAARRLPSRGRLRRAARAGARRQLLGEQRSTGELLRLAARGRPGLVAEAVGGLLGERLAAHDLLPVAARTPFRPSVPIPGGRPRSHGAGGVVLVYHRIVERDDPLGLSVSPANFAAQLDVLRAGWEVVALEDATRAGTVAITFDDGYHDNLAAFEQLAGLPATLFVSTGHVEEQRGFWWEQVRGALRDRSGPLRLRDRAWPRRSDVERRYLSAWLQGMAPAEQRAVLAELGVHDEPADRAMTIDELRGVAGRVTIGAHTRNHPSLAMLPPDEQREELHRSRADLEAWLGRPVTACAYPFGVPGADVSPATKRAARGFRFGCLNVSGAFTPQTDPLLIPRCTVPDIGAEAFAAGLRDSARG